MAHVFEVTEKLGDTVISTHDVVIAKWISLNDLSGVYHGGNGVLTDPLHTSEHYYMERFYTSDAVASAVQNSAPDIVIEATAGASSQTTPKYYEIKHKASGWFFRLTMYPVTGSTTDGYYFITAYWGTTPAGGTFSTGGTYNPQSTKLRLCACSIGYGTPKKPFYGFLICPQGGSLSVANQNPLLTGESALYGNQANPLPQEPTQGGGGFGTHDNTTDVVVNVGVKPSGFLSGILGGSGFNMYYVPSYHELIKAAYYSFNGVNNLSEWMNNTAALFLSPSTYIVSATALPADKSIFGAGAIQSTIRLGGFVNFNVSCYPLSSLWGDSQVFSFPFDGMYFDDFMDFEPYTKITLFLPYIGFVPVKAAECVGGEITVQYRFECLTGKCIAFVKTTDRNGRNTGYYQYSGDCGFSLPWVGNNGGGTQMIHSAASAAISIAKNKPDMMGKAAAFGLDALHFAAIDSRPTMQGGFGVNTGALGGDDIVLFIQRAQNALPANYYDIHGYQTATGGTVGDYSGYTEFEYVELTECNATDVEKAEIETLLKGGVYL